MNPCVEEMVLMHYGIKRRSGRYPWGSGDNPYQHNGDFLTRVEQLKNENFTFTDENGKTYTGDLAIAKSLGINSTQFRAQISLAKEQRRAQRVAEAKALREKGYSLNEIAEKMGLNSDSSVRSLLNQSSEARMNAARNAADFIKKQVDEKGMIDVGSGVELELGISKEKMREALEILKSEGYEIYSGGVPQVTNPGKQTTRKVICPPGTPHKDIYDYDNVHTLNEYTSHDGGDTFDKYHYPKSMDSKRLQIRYAEDGGINMDGVIEIRRGVKDLSLGDSHYAQVRILVDKDRYLKGMAVYADDLPPGVDVRFNTNKTKDTDMRDVLKKIKDDPDNPFGSLIKANGQSWYEDSNGKKQLSLINKTREEGDWGEWAKKLPSQFLSKQSVYLARKQLNLSIEDKIMEFDDIKSITNPTIKKELLKQYADSCDYDAVHLQAAALPRQKYQVILPVTSMKNNEVYAPNYNDGETVALIRFPHGGTFEIPILTVNNKQKDARKLLGTNAKDAVGINSKVAERLSGADFDGDTVMVIPCNSKGSKVKISSKPPLKDLEGFDPKMEYGGKPAGTFKPMKDTQKQMGVISNLITDMTIKGATDSELARAVKHSMVVIDAEKHGLDWKQSEIDNGIAALKKKYQGSVENGRYHEGASTLISRAKSQTSVVKRKGSPSIDPNTGEQVWKTTDNPTYVNKKTGKVVTRTQPSTRMAETKDPRTLISDVNSPMEQEYARYASQMKSLANQARLEMINTKKIEYSSSARTQYQEEYKSLKAKIDIARSNAPKERQAQALANANVQAKVKDNPDMTKSEIKKANQQALTYYRNQLGAKKDYIKLSEKEWEAIQAGAISENQLKQIIANADLDVLKQMATPRGSTTQLSQAKVNKIASMKASGYTNAEIAKAVGISTSTVTKYLS